MGDNVPLLNFDRSSPRSSSPFGISFKFFCEHLGRCQNKKNEQNHFPIDFQNVLTPFKKQKQTVIIYTMINFDDV